MVKIRDARLGMLYYFLMLCIVLYILVYQLIGQLGYLKFTAAQNTVRLTLQQPTAKSATAVNGCNPNLGTCEDSFTPISQLHYCCAQNASCTELKSACHCDYSGTSFATYNCTWLSGEDAGIVQESSISVTTFTHEYFQTLDSSCFSDFPDAAPACRKVWNVSGGPMEFTADVEEFTILFDHSVVSPATGLVRTSRTMQGMLYVGSAGDGSSSANDIQNQLCSSRADAVAAAIGGSPTTTAPCFLKPDSNAGLDYFTVGVLLQAMGVSLEAESYAGSGRQTRYDGLTANLVIEYSNSLPWRGQRDISYVYKPSVIPDSTFKTTSLMWTDLKGTSRQKKDQHGILFEVRPGGTLAVFNFTQLLLQLTTSLTLLALAAVGVNILAQYVLRYRHFYGEALYDDAVDFSHLSFLERQDDDVIQGELSRRNLPQTGSKYRRILRLLAYGWDPPAGSAAASFLESRERTVEERQVERSPSSSSQQQGAVGGQSL